MISDTPLTNLRPSPNLHPLSAELEETVHGVEMSFQAIPPELIDAIVDEIGSDVTTLKSCSLATTVFREPCQKRLLWRLALTNHSYNETRTYSEAAARFDVYPHLAGYVKVLELVHTSHVEDDFYQPLRSVLIKLTRVSILNIFSMHWPAHEWKDVPHQFAAPLLDFIRAARARGTLQQLSLVGLSKVPRTAMHHILMACPAVSLHPFSVQLEDDAPGLDGDNVSTSIERLDTGLEDLNSPGKCSLLLQYTRRLRALLLVVEAPVGSASTFVMPALCSATASTLECLSIDFSAQQAVYASNIAPPHLPYLRYLSISFDYQDCRTRPRGILYLLPIFLSNTLTQGAVPALTELVIRPELSVFGGTRSGADKLTYTIPAAIQELDDLLADYLSRRSGPAARWVPFFCFEHDTGLSVAEAKVEYATKHFPAFSDALRSTLSKATAMGMQVVDHDSAPREPMVEFEE
ncbi:hypothetical protein C8F01DRAFT_1261981 [Mycena amicta]|nr:hypothetical protein C8F01DRAFT_1261981 [Mycena amicta]